MRFTSLHQAVERPSSWQQDRFCPITRRLIEALEKCSAARLSATGTPSKRQQVHLFDWQPRSQTDKRRGEPLNLYYLGTSNASQYVVRSFHRSQRTNDAIAHYKTLPRSTPCSKSMLPSSLVKSTIRSVLISASRIDRSLVRASQVSSTMASCPVVVSLTSTCRYKTCSVARSALRVCNTPRTGLATRSLRQ